MMATERLPKVTLCLLVDQDRILLAMKKRGFGEGKWNGIGGKVNPNETPEEAAIRETKEEISVVPRELSRVGVIDFFFPQRSDWDQRCIVYLVESWDGEPTESEEMRPQWFSKNEIPYGKMWSPDRHWLPRVLNGEKILTRFVFDEEQQVKEFDIVNDTV